MLDLTIPSRIRADEMRNTSRYHRGLPVAVCEWDHGHPIVDSMQLGLTRDISDKGISLLTTRDLIFTEAVFCILVDVEISSELWFFHASLVRRCKYFGFVEHGMQINEYLNDEYRFQLQPLLTKLTQATPDESSLLNNGD